MAEKKPRGLRGFFSARRREGFRPAALCFPKGLCAHAFVSVSGNVASKFFLKYSLQSKTASTA